MEFLKNSRITRKFNFLIRFGYRNKKEKQRFVRIVRALNFGESRAVLWYVDERYIFLCEKKERHLDHLRWRNTSYKTSSFESQSLREKFNEDVVKNYSSLHRRTLIDRDIISGTQNNKTCTCFVSMFLIK